MSTVWDLDDLVEEYKEYVTATRGLRARTVANYERHMRIFVRDVCGDDPVDLSQLAPSDVVAFVASMAGRWSPASIKTLRTGLRSFLRFLRVQGVVDGARLEHALPRVAHWRLSTLPAALNEQQLGQVLGSLRSSTPCGARDRAIVWLLATLGLRPGEVADLQLDDLDWRAGTIELCGRKGRRSGLLPLPGEAASAIAEYLRWHRPPTEGRHVFVKQTGPYRGEPIGARAVSEAVARALRRAGVQTPMSGAYVFRHTVASRMVQRGASLKDVADVLGHRSLDTAAIYAKLDLPALREVALPWPEVRR